MEENELLSLILLNQASGVCQREVFCLEAALLPSVPEKVNGEHLVKVSLLDKGLVFIQENFIRPETWAPSMGKIFSVS